VDFTNTGLGVYTGTDDDFLRRQVRASYGIGGAVLRAPRGSSATLRRRLLRRRPNVVVYVEIDVYTVPVTLPFTFLLAGSNAKLPLNLDYFVFW